MSRRSTRPDGSINAVEMRSASKRRVIITNSVAFRGGPCPDRGKSATTRRAGGLRRPPQGRRLAPKDLRVSLSLRAFEVDCKSSPQDSKARRISKVLIGIAACRSGLFFLCRRNGRACSSLTATGGGLPKWIYHVKVTHYSGIICEALLPALSWNTRARYVHQNAFDVTPRRPHRPRHPHPRGCRHVGDAHVHFVLARRSDCPLRSGFLGLLRWRHRGACDRGRGAVVHPRGNAFCLGRARGLHRIVRDVRAGRRLSGGQDRVGQLARQDQRFRPDVRLHPHRADQQRVGRPISHRAGERAFPGRRDDCLDPRGSRRGRNRGHRHPLLLAQEPEGDSRNQRQGPPHHADHNRDGCDPPGVVRGDHHAAPSPAAAVASAAQSALRAGCDRLAQRRLDPADRIARHHDRIRPLRPGDERRRDAGPGQPGDRRTPR